MKILIVEDDRKIARTLEEGLRSQSYDVTLSETGEDAFFRIHSERFDLILLDIMLPGRTGLDILREIRKDAMDLPVLMLTARDGVEDRVQGLDAGADDYLVKPFAFAELLARIRSLIRRTTTDHSTNFSLSDLSLNLKDRKVSRKGKAIELTLREFDILTYLFRHKGNIVTREMLAKDVWKEANRVTPLDNVIDVHLARLRKKVDGSYSHKLIHTIRGVGFILRKSSTTEPSR